MILFVWLFSFGIMIPPLSGVWGTLGLDPETFSCTVLKDAGGNSPKKLIFVMGFIIPCVVIILCYSVIFYTVRKSRKAVLSAT